jgi:chemotaxis protein CheX
MRSKSECLMSAAKNFTITPHEGYLVIKLEESLDYHNCKLFDGEIESVLSSPTHVIIDCESILSIPKDWLRSLLKIQMDIKKDFKFLKLINVNIAVNNCLKKEGIDSAFKVAKDLRDALQEANLSPKRTLDTEFINPFLTATVHVLQVQASIEAHAGKIYMKKPAEVMTGDISGIIGIVSESFNGSVVISFPEVTFLHVMSSMLGEVYTKIDKDIIDGAGELTNMIFGQAKIVLNEKGYGIKTAIPSVISGKNHSLSAFTKGPVIVVPFETNVGNFIVEICMSN